MGARAGASIGQKRGGAAMAEHSGAGRNGTDRGAVRMSPGELTAFLDEVFPQIRGQMLIEAVGPMTARLRMPVAEQHLRPGGTVSGPAMFTLADCAFYVATLAQIGPEALNALSEDLMAALQAALDAVATDRSVRAVILRGAGRAFCAGHDLRQMQAARQAPDRGRACYQALFAQCSRLMTSIPRLPQPVIAQVHGIATAAGCQLVASCDLAVAADDTRFGVNGVNIGLFCSTPMVALSRNIGRKKTFELLTTGAFLSAAEAEAHGLINRAVPAAGLEAATRELAGTIAGKLATAIRHGKRAFYEQAEMPLDQAYAHTARVIAENMLEPETAEGVQAFLDKRPPNWED